MEKKTVDVYKKNKVDMHRLETYLRVLKGYLSGAYSTCNDIENNQKLFPTWNNNVTVYITAALDLISEMESYYGNR